MRLTVGPLPPAVYWRRRAIVLGAVLLVVLAFYAACGGSADGRKTGAASTPTPSAPAPTSPESALLTPETADPGGPAVEESPTAAPGTEVGGQPQAPGGDAPCTDDEITVTPIPAKTTIGAGKPVDIRLRITNVSNRTCSRDVGADEQELRVVQGAQTVWSSDHCGATQGSDVRAIGAGRTLDFGVAWNGKYSDKCSAGVPAGQPAAPGEYQVIARLGTKHSAPVPLTVRQG